MSLLKDVGMNIFVYSGDFLFINYSQEFSVIAIFQIFMLRYQTINITYEFHKIKWLQLYRFYKKLKYSFECVLNATNIKIHSFANIRQLKSNARFALCGMSKR